MKKRNVKDRIDIVLGTHTMTCSKCLHVRENEPFVKEVRYHRNGGIVFYYTCWRCCRDAESTFLIQQKWPMAFDRMSLGRGYMLFWAPGVRELVAKNDKV